MRPQRCQNTLKSRRDDRIIAHRFNGGEGGAWEEPSNHFLSYPLRVSAPPREPLSFFFTLHTSHFPLNLMRGMTIIANRSTRCSGRCVAQKRFANRAPMWYNTVLPAEPADGVALGRLQWSSASAFGAVAALGGSWKDSGQVRIHLPGGSRRAGRMRFSPIFLLTLRRFLVKYEFFPPA